MKILTDSPAFAEKIIGPLPPVCPPKADRDNPPDPVGRVRALADRLLRKWSFYRCGIDSHPLWGGSSSGKFLRFRQ